MKQQARRSIRVCVSPGEGVLLAAAAAPMLRGEKEEVVAVAGVTGEEADVEIPDLVFNADEEEEAEEEVEE